MFRMTTRSADSHMGALDAYGRIVEHVRTRHVDAARQAMCDLLAIAASRLG